MTTSSLSMTNNSNNGKKVLSETKTIRMDFPNFVSRVQEKQQQQQQQHGYMKSATLVECHGYSWLLLLFPNGRRVAQGYQDGYMSGSLRLVDAPEEGVSMLARIRIASSSSSSDPVAAAATTTTTAPWISITLDELRSLTFPNLIHREVALQSVSDDNVFSVEIDLQVWKDAMPPQQQQQYALDPPSIPSWTPPSMLSNDMGKLFESGVRSDVTFAVVSTMSNDDDNNDTIEYLDAHKNILAARCPLLYELVSAEEEEDDDDVDDNSKTNVERNTTMMVRIPLSSSRFSKTRSASSSAAIAFQSLLRFLYTEELPDAQTIAQEGRSLVHVADRFDCVSMKLALEAAIVDASITNNNNNNNKDSDDNDDLICAETAMEWLSFAESHSCALLKEAALHVIVMMTNHPQTLVPISTNNMAFNEDGFGELSPQLREEVSQLLLAAQGKRRNNDSASNNYDARKQEDQQDEWFGWNTSELRRQIRSLSQSTKGAGERTNMMNNVDGTRRMLLLNRQRLLGIRRRLCQ